MCDVCLVLMVVWDLNRASREEELQHSTVGGRSVSGLWGEYCEKVSSIELPSIEPEWTQTQPLSVCGWFVLYRTLEIDMGVRAAHICIL